MTVILLLSTPRPADAWSNAFHKNHASHPRPHSSARTPCCRCLHRLRQSAPPFQNFGSKQCLCQVLAPAHSAMVGQQHSLFAVQRTHGVLLQLLCTAKSVLGALHPAADNLHDILDNRRHSLMHSRKRTGINAVRMDYGTSLRISVVNSGVHLQFGRRNMLALNNFAITVDNDNVLGCQRFIAVAGGCNSNILRVNAAADVAPGACDELFSISAWPVSTMAAHALSLANNCVSMIIRQPDMPSAHRSGCRCLLP